MNIRYNEEYKWLETVEGDDIVDVFKAGDGAFFSWHRDDQWISKQVRIEYITDTTIAIRELDRNDIICLDWRYIDELCPLAISPTIDNVNHPSHYKSESGLEAIDVIKAFTADLKGFEATHTGNILKYILRWKHKNGIEDLKKAQWYLNDLINEIEKEND